MDLHITAKDFVLTPSLRSYAEAHIAHFEHYRKDLLRVVLTLTVERHHKKGAKHVVEGTIVLPGNDLHAEARATDMRSAIDMIAGKLAAQLRRGKEKSMRQRRA